ncbi:MAG TPA: hypothetical protein VGB30_03255 [bacterium]|jgi:hypothetical protein
MESENSQESLSEETLKSAVQPSHDSKSKFPKLLWIIFFIAIFGYFGYGIWLNARCGFTEKRAVNILRQIGKSQLAYQGTNNWRVYATFEGMVNDGYIERKYTQDNIIQEYSLTWRIYPDAATEQKFYEFYYSADEIPYVLRAAYKPEIIPASRGASTFTIIAYPDIPNKCELGTFGISDWQVVRMYVDDPEVSEDSFSSWSRID